MDIKELKSHAYDVMAQIEALQRELRATNQEIVKKSIEASKQEENDKTD